MFHSSIIKLSSSRKFDNHVKNYVKNKLIVNKYNIRNYTKKEPVAKKIMDTKHKLLEAKDFAKLEQEIKEQRTINELLLKDAEENAKKKKKSKYLDLFPGEEDIPSEAQILKAEIDREYEELEKIAGYAMHDPDYILYESVMKYRIRCVELEWMNNNEPMSGHSNLKLKEKIKEVVARTEEDFDNHLALFEHGTDFDIEQSRQRFLDELGGEIIFFEDDAWKKKLLKPEYDPRLNPYLEDEVKKSLGFSHTNAMLKRSVDDPNILYKDYDRLIDYLKEDRKGFDGATERILAHLEKEEEKKLSKKRMKKDLSEFDEAYDEEEELIDSLLDPNVSMDDIADKDNLSADDPNFLFR